MKTAFFTGFLLACLAMVSTAEASTHHHHYHHRHYRHHDAPGSDTASAHGAFIFGWGIQPIEAQPAHTRRFVARSYGDGRPRAWCGWYMRQIKGVADTAYNLARNWAHWGRATSPHVGAVVVWPHHVGQIVGQAANGQWLVNSGNDGHAVRTRARSLSGAIAFRE